MSSVGGHELHPISMRSGRRFTIPLPRRRQRTRRTVGEVGPGGLDWRQGVRPEVKASLRVCAEGILWAMALLATLWLLTKILS